MDFEIVLLVNENDQNHYVVSTYIKGGHDNIAINIITTHASDYMAIHICEHIGQTSSRQENQRESESCKFSLATSAQNYI